jgi:hypothetical protein
MELSSTFDFCTTECLPITGSELGRQLRCLWCLYIVVKLSVSISQELHFCNFPYWQQKETHVFSLRASVKSRNAVAHKFNKKSYLFTPLEHTRGRTDIAAHTFLNSGQDGGCFTHMESSTSTHEIGRWVGATASMDFLMRETLLLLPGAEPRTSTP